LLKCRNLENINSDIIENDSEVQPSVSTVDTKIKELKVEEAKQRISDVSPDDYISEHVLSDLKVYLSLPINEIGAFMSPTDMGSDENNIENINVPPISDDLKNAKGQESLCVPVDVLDIETVIHNDSVGSDVVGPEESTTRQPRPKRRFLSALGRGLLKVSRNLHYWWC